MGYALRMPSCIAQCETASQVSNSLRSSHCWTGAMAMAFAVTLRSEQRWQRLFGPPGDHFVTTEAALWASCCTVLHRVAAEWPFVVLWFTCPDRQSYSIAASSYRLHARTGHLTSIAASQAAVVVGALAWRLSEACAHVHDSCGSRSHSPSRLFSWRIS